MEAEIRRKVWDNVIPCEFVLGSTEVATTTPPPPFFAMVPRLGYFSAVCRDIMKHTKHTSPKTPPSESHELWLETNGKPLRWHLPVGVIFDTVNERAEIPWRITVHYQHFPASLLRCSDPQDMHTTFTNTLKEAMFLRHGHTKGVMQLSKDEQQLLFHSISKRDFDGYWRVNQHLLHPEGTRTSCRHVPVRFVFRNMSQPFVQKPIPPSDTSGQPHTVLSGLRLLLTQLITDQHRQLHSGSPAPQGPNAFPDTARPGAVEEGAQCYLHGQPLPMDTPLSWLVDHCACADNFVYIVTTVSPSFFIECLPP